MSEPIKPATATDEEISCIKDLPYPTSEVIPFPRARLFRLLARIQSDAAKLKERDEQIARLKDEIASLRPRERLHEAESTVIRFARAEMALSHYLDGEEEQEGVEADLAEEEAEALDAIRSLGRRLAGVQPVEVPNA